MNFSKWNSWCLDLQISDSFQMIVTHFVGWTETQKKLYSYFMTCEMNLRISIPVDFSSKVTWQFYKFEPQNQYQLSTFIRQRRTDWYLLLQHFSKINLFIFILFLIKCCVKYKSQLKILSLSFLLITTFI